MFQMLVTSNGNLSVGGLTCQCALGRSGVGVKAQEGDGITPLGTFAFRQVWYRPDREAKPDTVLPVRAIQPDDGWCDDPAHPAYNRPVKLPFSASHENLWRDDHCYDLFLELGVNDRPVYAGKGSAIFLHLEHDDKRLTAGCVALSRPDFLHVLSLLDTSSIISIRQSAQLC